MKKKLIIFLGVLLVLVTIVSVWFLLNRELVVSNVTVLEVSEEFASIKSVKAKSNYNLGRIGFTENKMLEESELDKLNSIELIISLSNGEYKVVVVDNIKDLKDSKYNIGSKYLLNKSYTKVSYKINKFKTVTKINPTTILKKGDVVKQTKQDSVDVFELVEAGKTKDIDLSVRTSYRVGKYSRSKTTSYKFE